MNKELKEEIKKLKIDIEEIRALVKHLDKALKINNTYLAGQRMKELQDLLEMIG